MVVCSTYAVLFIVAVVCHASSLGARAPSSGLTFGSSFGGNAALDFDFLCNMQSPSLGARAPSLGLTFGSPIVAKISPTPSVFTRAPSSGFVDESALLLLLMLLIVVAILYAIRFRSSVLAILYARNCDEEEEQEEMAEMACSIRARTITAQTRICSCPS